MSVTNPTFNFPLGAAELLDEVVVALDPPPALLELLELLLLPHATSARASAPAPTAARPNRLILRFTRAPFLLDRNANHSLSPSIYIGV
jgi:hypothetical protein